MAKKIKSKRKIKDKKVKKQSKYYAIKVGRGVKDKIVRSWKECKELVDRFPFVYKSFETEEEAIYYLRTVDVEEMRTRIRKARQHREELKSTTRVLNIRLEKELVVEFTKKCKEMEMTQEEVVKSMLKEWVYD